MTDRELTEAAAKAAGLPISHWVGHDYAVVIEDGRSVGWSPLVFDSDALRLAIKLRLRVDISDERVSVEYGLHDAGKVGVVREPIGSDPYAATSRAIVRAAAALA